jgi:hypothetical protein
MSLVLSLADPSALSALSIPAGVNVEIVSFVCMTLWTHGSRCWPDGRTRKVLFARHRFQVIRSNAVSNSAEVVQVEPIWDESSCQHKTNPMRVEPKFAKTELPVSIWEDVRRPLPARGAQLRVYGSTLVDFGPEPGDSLGAEGCVHSAISEVVGLGATNTGARAF